MAKCKSKQFLKNKILNKLSRKILAGKISDGDRLTMDYFEKSGVVFQKQQAAWGGEFQTILSYFLTIKPKFIKP